MHTIKKLNERRGHLLKEASCFSAKKAKDRSKIEAFHAEIEGIDKAISLEARQLERDCNPAEKYLPPKQLAAEIAERHGLSLTPIYLRAVRAASLNQRDGLFVAGCARASSVVAWLIANPSFSRRSLRGKG